MNRRPTAPLLLAASAFSGGIMVHRIAGAFTPAWLGILLTVASFAAIFAMRHSRTSRCIALVCLLASVASLNARFSADHGQNHIRRWISRLEDPRGIQVTIAGRLASDPTIRSGRTTFKLEVACIQLHASCASATGKIRTVVPTDDVQVAEGDGVVVSGRLRRPSGVRNPADFDFAAWLASAGISGILSHAHILQRCETDVALTRVVNRLRSGIRKTIREVVPHSSQDLPRALLLGDRSLLRADTRDDFARSGLMHLLAISGLHVMLVGMMLHRLLRPALMRFGCSWRSVETIRSVAVLALLIMYALVSGSGPSVVRAVVMTAFLLMGPVVQGVSNPINALGGAAMAILMFDSAALTRPGFQLSFSAVMGLLMLGRGVDADILRRLRTRPSRWIMSAIITSVVATLATTPALMYHFGYVGVAGLLLNVIAIPVGAALLCSSILCCLAAVASTSLAIPLGSSVDILTILLKWLAGLGGASDLLVLSPTSVFAFSASSLFILAALVTGHRGASRRWMAILSLTPPLVSLFFTLGNGAHIPRLTALFLDVGHGDAAILKLPGGQVLLSDTGNRHRFRDEGIKTVAPNLENLNIRKVRQAVISHPHADHLGGLPSLLRRGLVDCVSDNGQTAGTELYRETASIIDENQLCYKSLSVGDTLDLDPRVRIIVLAPPPLSRIDAINDRSVVLKVVFGRTSFLLTGDIETEAEDFLTSHYCDLLASDVVKVPHHGSRTSSTHRFVECTVRGRRQGFALVSVGSPLKYGLPDEEVIARWSQTPFVLHSTFNQGALWLESDGLNVRIRRWRD